MLKFAADLDTQFGGLPFLDRFEAAAAAGYRGAECRSPYAWPVEQIAHRLCLYGLELVQHALPLTVPGAASGTSATAAAAQRARRAELEQAVRYARALGVRQLSCPLPDGPDGVAQLAGTAALLRQHGLTLVAALRSAGGCGAAFAQIAALRSGGAENLYLQYRIDASTSVDDAAALLAGRLPLIRHVRLRDAAAPAAEPWLALLERLGYQGWVSCGAAHRDPHHAAYPAPHPLPYPPAPRPAAQVAAADSLI
jgi:hydroxypyruvate isomerase